MTDAHWSDWSEAGRDAPWTVGVEEEVMLLEPRTWALDSRSDEVLAALPDGMRGRTAAETHGSALELATAPQLRIADARGMPVLGICRGSQAINVARGGSLHQHLGDLTDGSIQHRQTARGRVQTHRVRIAPDTRLARTMGVTEAAVNSFHHPAVDRLGEGLRAAAWAPDGVIEAVEDDSDGMFMGVQWHAESLVEFTEELALFRALVEEAEGYSERSVVRAA